MERSISKLLKIFIVIFVFALIMTISAYYAKEVTENMIKYERRSNVALILNFISGILFFIWFVRKINNYDKTNRYLEQKIIDMEYKINSTYNSVDELKKKS